MEGCTNSIQGTYMIFLQYSNINANNPFGEVYVQPLLTYPPINQSTFDSPTESTLNNIVNDVFFKPESPQLEELRRIITYDFMKCLNPFDTVEVSRKAIALLDAYEHIRQAEATQLFSFNSSPHAVVDRYDFYTYLSKSISR